MSDPANIEPKSADPVVQQNDDYKPTADTFSVTDPVASRAGEPLAPPPDAEPEPQSTETAMDTELKAWVRANARWILAELDWTRSGRKHDERETLNP